MGVGFQDIGKFFSSVGVDFGVDLQKIPIEFFSKIGMIFTKTKSV